MSAFPAALPQRTRRRRLLFWLLGCVAVLIGLAAVAGNMVAHRIEPMLRKRIVNMLGDRFGSPVALDSLSVHYNGGFQVDGRGLRVQSVLHGVPGDAVHPMLQVEAFHFRVGLFAAMSDSPRIHHVRMRGVQLDLPAVAAQHGAPIASRHEVSLEYAEVDDAHIRFASTAADQAPLLFDLPHLELRGVSRSRPIRYRATVDNGTPIGITQTQGTIGPWNFDDPRLTPIEGSFGFRDRNVSSVRGLRGRLNLDGRYSGSVGQMHAEGTTSDPVFGLDVSSRTLPLKTKFAFTLNAVNGMFILERLEGEFGKTVFVCSGTAVKNRAPQGFRFDLQLHAPAARVEDVLVLGSQTKPPVMRGDLALDGRLQMRAGGESVSRKLSLNDAMFTIRGATFSNSCVQQTINELAERARGRPKEAEAGLAEPITAGIHGAVKLNEAELHFTGTHISMPGAQATVAGVYSLDGTTFTFDGQVHTHAKLSHMTTGVKSVLLKPFNGLFGHAHGRDGATLPLHISGVGDVPHFNTRIAGIRVKAPGAK